MSWRFLRFSPSLFVRGALRHYRIATGVCVLGPRYSGACGSSPPSSLALIGIYGFRGLYLVIITILVRSVIVRLWLFFGCGIENRRTYYDK